MELIDKSALVEKLGKWMNKIELGIATIPLHGRERADATFEYELLGKVRDFVNTFDTLEVKEVEDNFLKKFKSLQHITKDFHKTLEDWGYAPNLYYFDGSWHVDWISCEEGDSIKCFTENTAEEAINKAYNWFHSTFCNG